MVTLCNSEKRGDGLVLCTRGALFSKPVNAISLVGFPLVVHARFYAHAAKCARASGLCHVIRLSPRPQSGPACRIRVPSRDRLAILCGGVLFAKRLEVSLASRGPTRNFVKWSPFQRLEGRQGPPAGPNPARAATSHLSQQLRQLRVTLRTLRRP
jgi:hypothetical protein